MAAIDFPNDTEYERWRRDNPRAYVLNTNRSYSSSHTKLHRADCRVLDAAVTNTPAGHLTGADYHKVGAVTPKEAMSWLNRQRSDCEATYCEICCGDRIALQGGTVGNG